MATATTSGRDTAAQTSSQSPPRETSSHVFAGWRIWIAQRVPQRSLYLSKVIENGGQIVPLERHADIMIADHLRREVIPDTFSYKWIEACLAAQEIVPKEDHRAGPSSETMVARPVGSMVRPAKSGRNPFTAQDDRVLHQWVADHERKGGSTFGNEIYKQLEAQNSRHPWQSWRDRYVKYLSKRPPPPVSVTQETPPTPPSDDNAAARTRRQQPRTEPQSQDDQDVGQENEQPPSASVATTVVPLPSTSQPERTQTSAATQEEPSIPITLPAEPSITSTKQPSQQESGVNSASSSRTQSQPQSQPLPAQTESSPWVAPFTPLQGQTRPSPNQAIPQPRRPFSVAEHQLLVDNVDNIQASMIERYENLWWDTRIFDLKRHSPEEWRLYYETKVLPDWKKLPNEVKQKRLSDVYERSDHDETAELLHDPQHIYSTNPTPQKPRLSSLSVDPSSQPVITSSEARKRAREVIDIDDDSESPSSLKRRRQGSNSDMAQNTAESERNVTQPPLDSQTLREPSDILGTRSREGSQQQPIFDVFEDRELPDDEKENVMVDREGSYSLPPRHVHVRSSEALEAFSEPLPTFTLQPRFTDANEELETPISGRGENETADLEQDVNDGINDSIVVQVHTPPRQQQQQQDTQALINDETQAPDLTIVSPNFNLEDDAEDEEVDFETIQPSLLVRRPQSQTADEDGMIEQEDIDSDDDDDGSNDLTSFLNFDRRMQRIADTEHIITAPRHRTTNETTQRAPSPPSLFVTSVRNSPRIHPTVSHITVRKELHENPHAIFSSPPPPALGDEDDYQNKHNSPPTTAAPAPQQDTQSTSAVLEQFIASETASGRHTQHDILYALQRGNCDPSIIPTILGYLARGESLPRGVKGIWTEEDDEALKGGDARAIRRLEDVHGRDALGVRLAVLNSWEDIEY